MIIKSLADLKVHQLALEAADAVSAILNRPSLLKDVSLRDDLAETSARIPSHIAEGFGHGTDRHCAHFQRIARGSANEMCTHLKVAHGRRHIASEEWSDLTVRYVVIGKMLTNWLKHLVQENRRFRG